MIVYVVGKHIDGLQDYATIEMVSDVEKAKELILRSDAVIVFEKCPWEEMFAVENKIPVYLYPDLPEIPRTEIERPLQSREFIKIVMGMYRTHLEKNADYSPANILATGDIGLATRLWDKVARLLNLNGVKIEIDDTYFDQYVIDGAEVIAGIYTSVITMMSKMGFRFRIKDIQIAKPETPKNESIEDSYLDLAVYGVIGKIYRAGFWGK